MSQFTMEIHSEGMSQFTMEIHSEGMSSSLCKSIVKA
jgi:hypothetical protein